MDKKNTRDLLLYFLSPSAAVSDNNISVQLSTSDWHSLTRQAVMLGVAPLLYHRLKSRTVLKSAPAEIIQKLQAVYVKTAYRNKLLYRELETVLTVLQQRGIPVIVLKGAHLAEIVYGNIALRPMGDIDILVKEEHLHPAEQQMLALGYDPPEHPRLKKMRVTRRSRILFSKPDGASLEVHWVLDRPGSPFTIDNAGLWERARPEVIAGIDTLTLSPDDLLLHLCWQASANKVFSTGMTPLCDIAVMLRHYGSTIDWDTVIRRAREWRLERCVYLTLYITRDLLNIEIPEKVLEALRPQSIAPEIIAVARENIFNSPAVSDAVLHIGSAPGIKSKIVFGINQLFPARTVIADRYNISEHSMRIYYFYGLRFKYLLAKYRKALWDIVTGDVKMAATIKHFKGRTFLKSWLHQAPEEKRR